MSVFGAYNSEPGPCDTCGRTTTRGRNQNGRLCVNCARIAYRAKRSRIGHVRRTRKRYSDITTAYETELRRRAKRCPLCHARLVDEPGRPNSKHLDHVVPIAAGGTHTVGNVRIICATCNLARPYDCSDLTGMQITLWAMDPEFVSREQVMAECA